MASSSFILPAGLEDDSSDEDGFSFGDETFKERKANIVNQRPPVASSMNGNSSQEPSRGGFGAAPLRKPPNVIPFTTNNYKQQKSKPIHQRNRQSQDKNSSASDHNNQGKKPDDVQNEMKDSSNKSTTNNSTPEWMKSETIPIDDFRMAVIRNNTEAIKDYLDQGMAVDTVFSSGWTALMYAANASQDHAVSVLLDRGADPNFNKDLYTVLMAACSCNKDNETDILACVILLLGKGADVNAYDRHHVSSLIYATRKGRTAVVKCLIEAGADINKQDNKGNTALMWAATHNQLLVIQALLLFGADLNKQRCDGSKAVDIAFVQGHQKAEELIRSHDDPSKQITVNDLVPETNPASENTSLSMIKMGGSSREIYKYGDLELFLSGIELSQLIPTFQDHQVNFQGFLRMTDKDLQQLGITQMGVRKKILDAVRDTHKKSWETSSINKIEYNTKITCADAVAMVTNIKKHASYIGSSVGYITDQMKSHNDCFANAQDGAGSEELSIQTEEALTNVKFLYEELSVLREHLTEVAETPEYTPPDLIHSSAKTNRRQSRFYFKGFLAGAAICGVIYYKQDFLSKGLSSFSEKLFSYSK